MRIKPKTEVGIVMFLILITPAALISTSGGDPIYYCLGAIIVLLIQIYLNTRS